MSDEDDPRTRDAPPWLTAGGPLPEAVRDRVVEHCRSRGIPEPEIRTIIENVERYGPKLERDYD